MTIKTLIKASLQSDRSGKRVADIAADIGSPYPNTYQTISKMCDEGLVYKVARGIYALSGIPQFTTRECISLLQSIENQEIAVEIAREELDQQEARLDAIKRTIRQTMRTAFED